MLYNQRTMKQDIIKDFAQRKWLVDSQATTKCGFPLLRGCPLDARGRKHQIIPTKALVHYFRRLPRCRDSRLPLPQVTTYRLFRKYGNPKVVTDFKGRAWRIIKENRTNLGFPVVVGSPIIRKNAPTLSFSIVPTRELVAFIKARLKAKVPLRQIERQLSAGGNTDLKVLFRNIGIPYKHETVNDIWGDPWVVYESYPTVHGFHYQKGAPLGSTDAVSPRGILTIELAQYLQSCQYVKDIELPINESTVWKLRRQLESYFACPRYSRFAKRTGVKDHREFVKDHWGNKWQVLQHIPTPHKFELLMGQAYDPQRGFLTNRAFVLTRPLVAFLTQHQHLKPSQIDLDVPVSVIYSFRKRLAKMEGGKK
jgi:hypothetical protein